VVVPVEELSWVELLDELKIVRGKLEDLRRLRNQTIRNPFFQGGSDVEKASDRPAEKN
tara:strand:+ start:345 stop:518 length:174 start_codon:yes stop_codon:yes gene_type:complete